MKFKKKDLEFLKIYSICSDTRSELHDKVQIKADSKEGKITFSQFSMDANLVTQVDNVENEDFSIVYPINTLTQMLRLCKEDSVIEITKDDLKFSDNSQYKFESFNYDFDSNVRLFLDIIDKETPIKKYTLKDLGKLNINKNFIGITEDLQYVRFEDNHFITSDRENITCVCKSDNNINDTIFLPRIFLHLYGLLEEDEINLSLYEDTNKETLYIFNIGKTYVSFNIGECSIPNIFDEEFKEIYDHKHKVEVDREKFLEAVKRIRIVTVKEIGNRVFVTFNKDSLLFESKDVGYASEKVQANVDNSLIGVTIVLSSVLLNSIANMLKDEKIIIKASREMDATVATIVDESNMITFINNLFENIE